MNKFETYTYTGKKIDIAELNINDISIYDIAHSLSNICMYHGHCKSFYSLAEHSILLSKLLINNHPFNNKLAFIGLLYKSYIVYTGYLPRLQNNSFNISTEREKNIRTLILQSFNIDIKMINNEEIQNLLIILERYEAEHLIYMPDFIKHTNGSKNFNIELCCWTPVIAEKMFLRSYYQLINKGIA